MFSSTLNDVDAETIGQCFSGKCDGRLMVITGCSVGGLGFEVARVFAKYGAEVIMCCHTQEACDTAMKAIRSLQLCNNMIQSIPLNLASLVSVQRCAETILSMNKPIDVLVNNAATKECETKLTEDGFELQWQVNYLGHFYFTNLLLPLLVQAGAIEDCPARVINVSSMLQYVYCAGSNENGLDFKEMRKFTTEMDDEKSAAILASKDCCRWFAESKLAMVIFAKEITRRMFPHVIGVSLHPGIVPTTNAYRSLSLAKVLTFAVKLILTGRVRVMRKEKHKTIPQGAATTVYCAIHSNVRGGEYYADCAVSEIVADQAKNDSDAGRKLWEASQQQIDHRLQRIQEVRQKLEQIMRSSDPDTK